MVKTPEQPDSNTPTHSADSEYEAKIAATHKDYPGEQGQGNITDREMRATIVWLNDVKAAQIAKGEEELKGFAGGSDAA